MTKTQGPELGWGQARLHGRGMSCANNRWETEVVGTQEDEEWREMRWEGWV